MKLNHTPGSGAIQFRGVMHLLVNTKTMLWMCSGWFIVLASMVMGQEQSALLQNPEKDWEIRLGIPLWVAGLDGTVGINNRLAEVDESFSDIADILDFAAALNLEMRKDGWLFFANGFYTKTTDEAKPGGLLSGVVNNVELRQKQLLVNAGLGYKVLARDRWSLEVLGGARLNYVDARITLSLPASTPSLSGSKTWTDPIFGVNGEGRLSESLALFGYADVGGFGVSSDLTWQVNGGMQWDMTRHFYLRGSYRFLHTDYRSGGFRFDVDQHGPQLELGVRF